MHDIKKDIIYPIFLECCKYCVDSFWVNIFEDLSYGKTPYGVYISKNFLCCNYKNKEFSYKIENENPEKLYNNIHDLLYKKLGILSTQEKIKRRIDFNNMEDSIKESKQTWNSIKKKNLKDILIEKYVLNEKKKNLLTFKQSRYLLCLIFITMVFKIITQKDIIYNNGVIKNIEGINISKKNIKLKRTLYDTEINIIPQIYIEKKSMSDNWEKYLKELKKNVL